MAEAPKPPRQDLDGLSADLERLEREAQRVELARLYPEGARATCQDGYAVHEVTITGHSAETREVVVKDDNGLEYRVRPETLRVEPQAGE